MTFNLYYICYISIFVFFSSNCLKMYCAIYVGFSGGKFTPMMSKSQKLAKKLYALNMTHNVKGLTDADTPL